MDILYGFSKFIWFLSDYRSKRAQWKKLLCYHGRNWIEMPFDSVSANGISISSSQPASQPYVGRVKWKRIVVYHVYYELKKV